MLIPSKRSDDMTQKTSLSRRVNANSQQKLRVVELGDKLIKKGEC